MNYSTQKNKGSEAFNAFLQRLDPVFYGKLIRIADPYEKIRFGLAHSYLMDGDVDINIERSGYHGIEYDPNTVRYVFWVGTYFDEFRAAVTNYIRRLNAGTEDLEKFENCMKDKPDLI